MFSELPQGFAETGESRVSIDLRCFRLEGENAAAPRVKSENRLCLSENPRWCAGEMRYYASGRVAVSLSQRCFAPRMASVVTEEESSQVRGMRWLK